MLSLTRVEQVHVLCLILVLAKKKLGNNFRFRSYQLQRILSSSQAARELFIFSDSGPESFSPELESALGHLSLCGFLKHPDLQDPGKVTIPCSWLSWVDRILREERMSKDILSRIKRVSDYLVTNLRVH